MTRRDFQMLAAALARVRPPVQLSQRGRPTGAYRQWLDYRASLADGAEATYPRFDRSRFYTATEA